MAPKFTRRRLAIAGSLAVLLLIAIAAATSEGRWVAARATSIVACRLGRGAPDLGNARERLAAKLPPGSVADAAATRIVVRKSRRIAEVVVDGHAVLEYPIVLGSNPEGTKEREGDGRTPEGTYRICTRLDRSSYHLFLGLSYPGTADADAGLRRGAIDAGLRDVIAAKDEAGDVPPWNTALGGAVGLHGGGVAFDWTLGCVAFEDDDIEEVWLLTQIGTAVEIVP